MIQRNSFFIQNSNYKINKLHKRVLKIAYDKHYNYYDN